MAVTARENIIMALEHKIPEWIPNYRTDVCQYVPSCVHERAPGDGSPAQSLGGTGKDWFGVDWVFEPVIGGSMVDPKYPPLLDDITKWREIVKIPDMDAIDWKAAREKDERMIKPDKFYVITLLNGPYERMHSLMGMIEANCALLTDPEDAGALLMAIADFKIKLVDKLVEYYPVDMIEVHDDWGHQRNTFMSLETWRQLIAPAMEKIVGHIKAKGKFVQVHSCGKVETLIPDMIEIGIDHWSSCQACNDIRSVICKYGDKLTCLGGMDAPELTADSLEREELKERVKTRLFDLCKGCGILPYGSRSYPILVDLISEVLSENPDFYKNPENCKLPSLE